MDKNKVKRFLLISVVVFVVLLIIELIVVRIVDDRRGKNTVAMNTMKRIVKDIDVVEESTDSAEYSVILERMLTEEELKEQKILEAQKKMITYNNIGLAQDIVLPDGSFLLDEDGMYVYISVKTEGDAVCYHVFSMENEEILNRYRSYWGDSFYSYDKNTKEMEEKYRYYQLVLDRFYLDGMEVIPEQVSIYKVERMPMDGEEYPEVTGFELMETIRLADLNVEGLDCYELVTEIDSYTVTGLSYDYTCNGMGEYRVMKDITLNGKYFSLEERKELLTDFLDEKYELQDRDLIGVSKYYYQKNIYNSELLGGNVTTLVCESNILYNFCLYAWKLLLLVLMTQMMVSVGIAAIVIAVKNKKESSNR